MLSPEDCPYKSHKLVKPAYLLPQETGTYPEQMTSLLAHTHATEASRWKNNTEALSKKEAPPRQRMIASRRTAERQLLPTRPCPSLSVKTSTAQNFLNQRKEVKPCT